MPSKLLSRHKEVCGEGQKKGQKETKIAFFLLGLFAIMAYQIVVPNRTCTVSTLQPTIFYQDLYELYRYSYLFNESRCKILGSDLRMILKMLGLMVLLTWRNA